MAIKIHPEDYLFCGYDCEFRHGINAFRCILFETILIIVEDGKEQKKTIRCQQCVDKIHGN